MLRLDDKTYMIRLKAIDPRTGRKKEVAKLLEGVSAQQASQQRAELMDGIKQPVEQTGKVRVGEFAKSWIESKTLRVDSATARTYADALEGHILPALGDYYDDALTSQDVQRWIDSSIKRGWTTNVKEEDGEVREQQRAYARNTIAVWFRTFRTMTRDAMVALNLQRDPTLRVELPPSLLDNREPNSLTAEQLAEFLTAMRTHYPQHYGLVMVLAYTGLRWCHASALRWEDFDEEAGVLRIERKQVRGVVGPVSRKKRAPKEYPIEPELAAVLKWHRQRLFKEQAPGLEAGWMFPSSSTGTLRTPNSLDRAWAKCLTAAEIPHRFTIHGLRYTFTDLVRRANVDSVVRRALTGHVTEEMQRRYSTVGMDEKRAAVAGVIRLVPPEKRSSSVCDGGGGTRGGTEEPKSKTA